jgi:hypothetical protein
MATDTNPPPQTSLSQSERAGERYLLYTVLFSVQTAGAAVIFLQGVPIYRLIVNEPGPQYADVQTFAWLTVAILAMQFSYWFRLRLMPRISLPAHIVLSHVILFFARIGFVFATALFSTIVILRLPDITFSVPRFAVLIAALFSLFCYTLELEQLGRSLGTRTWIR